jgi:glucosamine 6-phosphate synthetase-like amidotransferase/phosphosugar isomerase protein
MCGIAGSSDFEKAYNLYKINLQRGSQSTGLMAVIPGKKLYFIHKKPGIFDEEDCESFKEKFKESKWDYSYFLFHSRAPTNTTDTVWSEETTHPFYENEYFLAHNGIITNFKNLPNYEKFKVDSSIIPNLLNKNQSIKETFSGLEGLLTSWIFHLGNLFLVKAGSSLWIEKDSFSSSEFENSIRIEEDGIILQLEDGKFVERDKFNYNNIYFI